MLMSEVCSFLAPIKGTRFTGIDYVTKINPAAKHKDKLIQKHVTANVQIFSSLHDYTVYENAVIRSANRIKENDKENVSNFEKSENWFSHDEKFFSIVERNQKKYLFCIFNSVSKTEFYLNGEKVDKNDILQYLTPSEVKKLTEDNSIVYNKSNDILHNVHVRTISLENIINLR